MTSPKSRKHRSPAVWQSLIDHWQQSGLSAQAFCHQHKIGYASFCNWRKRLNEESVRPDIRVNDDFIDVSGFSSPRLEVTWSLWLRLANLAELRITRS